MLKVTPPFRLDLTVRALRRRESNLIDQWDGVYYQRVLIVFNKPILICVSQKNKKSSSITVTTHRDILEVEKKHIKIVLKEILGLNFNADNFYALALKDQHLKLVVEEWKGLKPPKFPSLFESLCNAVACQQLSLNVGIELLNRLTEHYGKKVTINKKNYFAFPTPIDISKCKPNDLHKLGFSLNKSTTLINIANLLKENESNIYKKLSRQKDDQVISFLQHIKGIGRWSCEYVLLRGFRRLHVFPGDDVGGQNNLQKLMKLDKKLNYELVGKIITPWDPFAGFVYFHLLLSNAKIKEGAHK